MKWEKTVWDNKLSGNLNLLLWLFLFSVESIKERKQRGWQLLNVGKSQNFGDNWMKLSKNWVKTEQQLSKTGQHLKSKQHLSLTEVKLVQPSQTIKIRLKLLKFTLILTKLAAMLFPTSLFFIFLFTQKNQTRRTFEASLNFVDVRWTRIFLSFFDSSCFGSP